MDATDQKAFLRPTPESVRIRLAEAGYAAPDACIPGIMENLIVLQDHALTIRQLPLDERHELAPDQLA